MLSWRAAGQFAFETFISIRHLLDNILLRGYVDEPDKSGPQCLYQYIQARVFGARHFERLGSGIVRYANSGARADTHIVADPSK